MGLVVIDNRQKDVRAAEVLIAAAQRHGAAPLPSLIGVDLCALVAAQQAVFDEQVWRTWLSLDTEARDQLTINVLNGLGQRGLIRTPSASDPDGTFEVAAPLALIMASRDQPAFIVVSEADGNPRGAPRMYGVADEDFGLRAVVVEDVSATRVGLGTGERRQLDPAEDLASAGDLNQVYKYVLVSPERASAMLADWMQDGSSAGTRRQVDAYWHRNNEHLMHATVATTSTQHDGSAACRYPDGNERSLSSDDLTRVFSELMALATRP